MRKLLIHITLLLLVSLRLLAQTCPKANEAIKAYQAKDLEGAKKMIDQASVETACSTQASTWYYKAFIYKEYYKAKESTQKNSVARKTALESARKNLEIDPQNKYALECKKIIHFLAESHYNDAVNDLNNQKFAQAYDNYVRYLDFLKYIPENKTDTSAIFFAGYSAFMANNLVKAKEYLNKALELKYQDPNLYYILGKLYSSTGEREKSYQVLNEGLRRYPENKDILYTLVNYYLEEGKLKTLENYLEKAIQLEPNNLDLKNTLALVCEKLLETEKTETTKYSDKAERLYKEVIKRDPKNFRANFNLAVLYYNKAIAIIDNSDYDKTGIEDISKLQDKTLPIFMQSKPYMEKAYEIDPNRKEVLEGLAGIYFALNEIDKSNEFKQKAEALGK